jgi:hypothetical protein
MPTMLETTKALLASNRARREGVPPLRETVRALFATGLLPPASGKVVTGYGTGKRCVICYQSVTSEQVEYEVDGRVICHLPCFNVWREETIQRAIQALPDDGTGVIDSIRL